MGVKFYRTFTSQGVAMFQQPIYFLAAYKYTQSLELNCVQPRSCSLTPLSSLSVVPHEKQSLILPAQWSYSQICCQSCESVFPATDRDLTSPDTRHSDKAQKGLENSNGRAWMPDTDSSFSIVSVCRLGDRATGVRSPAEANDISSSLCVQTSSDAHPASCTTGNGSHLQGVKRG